MRIIGANSHIDQFKCKGPSKSTKQTLKLNKIKNLTNYSNFDINISKVNHQKYKNLIKEQKNEQTYSNLASLLFCFEISI